MIYFATPSPRPAMHSYIFFTDVHLYFATPNACKLKRATTLLSSCALLEVLTHPLLPFFVDVVVEFDVTFISLFF